MLLSIHLRDFVIVDALDLDFGPGFNVLTGETGAGKSILLDALQLAIGARSDASWVRDGASKADITASFTTTPNVDAWLTEHALEGDDGVIQLRRIIDTDGKSKAFINGAPSTAALQREVGDLLLEIHGQFSNQALLKTDGQRQLLDEFAGNKEQRTAVKLAWTSWQEACQALARAQSQGRELALERDRLEWQLQELDSLAPQAGEWEHLSEEQKRLQHAQELLQAAAGGVDQLSEGSDPIIPALEKLASKLQGFTRIDKRFEPIVSMLNEATVQLQESSSELAGYVDASDMDSERAQTVESRLSELHQLARKLKSNGAELASLHASIKAQHQTLADAQNIDVLQKQALALEQHYLAAAKHLSSTRKKAASLLAKGMSDTIQGLGMAGGQLAVDITSREPSAVGVEAVEFLVKSHASATPRPLAKVASGGELSRVSLGITVTAAKANPTPSLLFDEADAGVGGAVAEKIGHLMRQLGGDRQVLTVTHLPQVAALANHHMVVTKESNTKNKVVSRVQVLDRAQRVEEIARMLGGVEITATTRKHAKELLAQ